MRILLPLLFATGCGSGRGELYVGTGTAVVIPADPTLEQQTRTNADEEVRVRHESDGGLVLDLDGCELATGPLRDGQATLTAGTSCEGSTRRGTARLRLSRGTVALWPDGERLSFSFEGDGESRASGNRELVRTLYSFSGTRRRE